MYTWSIQKVNYTSGEQNTFYSCNCWRDHWCSYAESIFHGYKICSWLQSSRKILGLFQPIRVNAYGIAEVIMRELGTIVQGDNSKVVAETYDGASVMKRRIGEVHVKVKQVYRNAYCIHCAAHKLNLILSMAATCNKEAKLFFSKLDRIPTFFSKSPERKRATEVFVPSGFKTRWNYNSRMQII